MKCPDCGEPLYELTLMGTDKSYRCFRCGGFWVNGWVVNGLDVRVLAKWSPIKVDQGWLNQGTNACPVDETQLARYKGESIPVTLVVKRCERCGRWWFPTDTLLQYKPAVAAKLNYFRLWGLPADVKSVALPALGLILLFVASWAVGLSRVQIGQVLSAFISR